MQFSRETIHNINNTFKIAFEEGRQMLYEYEVYKVLNHIGIEVPEFALICDPEEVNGKILKKFGQTVVIKIISPQIAHKQKLGGVKIVKNLDPLYIQFVITRMREEVLSHFNEDSKPEIKGFLLSEFVPHTQAIGYEVLLGFKEDSAFGPVLTLSKGGDDAEFFAKYYNPANLFLPPLDCGKALEMVNTLNIRHKFEETGHPEYMEYMAEATSLLSGLAYEYSSVGEKLPEYVIKSMDVNPFVITEDSRFVAIDGFVEFVPSSQYADAAPKADTTNLKAFFNPEGIAVIGVSGDMSKYSMGRDIADLLHDMGREDLYLVNAKGGAVTLGGKEYALFSRLQDIPHKVELVVYAAPAQHTVEFIKSLPKDGPKGIILISGIPSNMNYPEFIKELDAVILKDLRIIGPNCMGVYYGPEKENRGLNTLFINDEERLEVKSSAFSNVVLLTQSGALAVTAIDKLRNSRLFQSVVSFGNKYDVNISDLVAYFANEANIDVISIYVEGLDYGEGRQFFEIAQQTEKPIIAYKSGKTEAGAKAAASHTASMSGSYGVFKAACMQSGVILAENIEDYYDYVKVFSLLADKIPTSNRVAGVVNAGFESTVGADELKNLKQAQLSKETVEKLNAINKYGLVDTSSPFLDVTPMADDRMYADFVEAILQDDQVDCVFVALVPHAVTLKTTPDTCHDPDSLANLLVQLGRKYNKPMVVSVNAGRYYQDFVSIMEENGLPVYTDIRSSIKSLDTFVTYNMKNR